MKNVVISDYDGVHCEIAFDDNVYCANREDLEKFYKSNIGNFINQISIYVIDSEFTYKHLKTTKEKTVEKIKEIYEKVKVEEPDLEYIYYSENGSFNFICKIKDNKMRIKNYKEEICVL